MHVQDLKKVQIWLSELKKLEAEHKSIVSLTAPNGGAFGLDERAFIRLGGDSYGNGTTRNIEFKINEIPELVRYCRKLESDAWGKVVSVRANLRTLGVDLDERSAQK